MIARKKNAVESKALKLLYEEWLAYETESAKERKNLKQRVTYENFVQKLRENGMVTDEVLLPMGYISLPEYCEKHGCNEQNMKRMLDSGDKKGIKKDGIWYLDEDVNI